MAHPRASQKRAQALSSSLFLIGLAVLSLTGSWWPAIMLVLGLPLALRQFLLGKTYDMCLSLVIFVGAFIAASFDISWNILLPVLFIMGALYLLIREFADPTVTDEAEDEESLNKQFEEHEK